jgi:Putative adhesin
VNDRQFAEPDPNPYANGYGSYGQQDGNPYSNPFAYGYGQQDAKPEPNPTPNPYGYAEQEANQYQYNYGQSSSEPMASNAGTPSYTLAPPPPHLPDYPTLEQQHFQPKRRRPRLGIMLVMLLLLISAGIGGMLFISHSRSTTQSRSTSTTNPITSNSNPSASGQITLSVTAHPTIVIENDTGSIRVHAGTGSDKVILQSSKSGSTTGSTAIPSIPYTETSDHSTIVISLSASNANGYNLDVTVPVTSDLKLYTNESNIFVNGVKGQMNLDTNSGTITVSYSTINTASIIDNNSGAITAVRDTLNGNVTLLNNSGTITFSGSITPSGNYQFTGNGGLMDITLPHDGTFHVDATANNSTVTSNFPGAAVQNGEIHANIGISPRAKVTIYNNNGAVALHAGNGS